MLRTLQRHNVVQIFTRNFNYLKFQIWSRQICSSVCEKFNSRRIQRPIVGGLKPPETAYPKYHFNCGVKDGHTRDIKQQTEERDGDHVKGEYSLVEPNGRVRNVKYEADSHNGFNAIVTKSGHASHPHTASKISVPLASHALLNSYH